MDLLKYATRERLNTFVALAVGRDKDIIDMTRAIVLDGCTPREAARAQVAKSTKNVNVETLYYHARGIWKQLLEFIGLGIEACAEELLRTGTTRAHSSIAGELMQRCSRSGVDVESWVLISTKRSPPQVL